MNRSGTSVGRRVTVIVLALLLGVEVARIGIASAVADTDPQRAAQLAPQSAASLTTQIMTDVGRAAASGGDPGPQTFAQLRTLAAAAPLQPEPFLVEAALAERRQDYRRASQLLRDALQRDPRSVAAHFLYGDVALRQGDVLEALQEMAVLSRLVPGASMQMVPGLSQFAKTPGSRDKLAHVLAENPQLKGPLLSALAADPDNADLIVGLAGPRSSFDRDTRAWQSRLLTGLTDRGDYQRAYELWQRFAGIPGGRQLLFNGEFADVPASPPFNWSLSSSAAGVSELGPKALRVLYYGRQDAALAWQTLLLPAGTYRLNSAVAGNPATGALSWSITCIGARGPLMSLPLRSGPQSQSFTIPASGCAAQKIELDGHLLDDPDDSDVQVGPVSIARSGS